MNDDSNQNPTPIEQMTPNKPKRNLWKLVGIVFGVILVLLFILYMAAWYFIGQETANTPKAAPERAANVEALSAKDFATDPCKILSDAQLKEFDYVPSPSPMPNPDRPDCGFNPKTGSSPGIVIVAVKWAGFSSLDEYYEANADGGFKFFKPTEIQGYPAVYNEVAGHKTDCRLSTAISDDQVLSVYVDWSKEDQTAACDLAKKVTEAVIATLRQ